MNSSPCENLFISNSPRSSLPIDFSLSTFNLKQEGFTRSLCLAVCALQCQSHKPQRPPKLVTFSAYYQVSQESVDACRGKKKKKLQIGLAFSRSSPRNSLLPFSSLVSLSRLFSAFLVILSGKSVQGANYASMGLFRF